MKSSTPPPRLARVMANLGLSFLGAEIMFGLIVLVSRKAGLVPGPQGEVLAAWFFLSILYVPVLVLGVFLCWAGARRAFPRTIPFTGGAATMLGCGVGSCLAALALFTDIL